MPQAHPFNPLPLLRLALACGNAGKINRFVAETVFRHVWRGGADAGDASRLAGLTQILAPARDPASDEVKGELKANAEKAIAFGLFGVPSMVVDGKLLWGFDALLMLREFVDGGAWFDSGAWEQVAAVPAGVQRTVKKQ